MREELQRVFSSAEAGGWGEDHTQMVAMITERYHVVALLTALAEVAAPPQKLELM